MQTAGWLLLIATVVNAMLVGASLDQSIKQLPARRRIGIQAFSAYSQASDLGNGILWYAVLGAGGALFTVIAAIVALASDQGDQATVALALVIALTAAHSLATSRAAPTNFSQRKANGNPEHLAAIFDRFERLHTIRAGLQVLTLAAVSWSLAAMVS